MNLHVTLKCELLNGHGEVFQKTANGAVVVSWVLKRSRHSTWTGGESCLGHGKESDK